VAHNSEWVPYPRTRLEEIIHRLVQCICSGAEPSSAVDSLPSLAVDSLLS
jgi:hypothetical protein